jgi:hypothetical protein
MTGMCGGLVKARFQIDFLELFSPVEAKKTNNHLSVDFTSSLVRGYQWIKSTLTEIYSDL